MIKLTLIEITYIMFSLMPGFYYNCNNGQFQKESDSEANGAVCSDNKWKMNKDKL